MSVTSGDLTGASGRTPAASAPATRLALLTMAGGFLFEAGTEVYQLASSGRTGPLLLYYVGLVTTGVGFYFMYRGRKEWNEHHHLSVLRGHRHLWAAVGTFAGAVAAIAIVSDLRGAGPGLTDVAGWLAGGLVALSFGNFFLGLTLLVDRLAPRWGRGAAWTAFAWSLGVAGLTGYVVAGEFVTLLDRFFTDPLGLVASFAPLAFAISPLFVSYLLYAAAYSSAVGRLGRTSPSPPATSG